MKLVKQPVGNKALAVVVVLLAAPPVFLDTDLG